MRGTDQGGELLLAQAGVHPVFDEEPGDLAKPRSLGPLAPVLRAVCGTARRSCHNRGTDRTRLRTRRHNLYVITSDKLSRSRGIAASGSRRPARHVHPPFEVSPAGVRHVDVCPWNGPRSLLQRMQQHEQVTRSPVKDPVQLASIMASKCSETSTRHHRVRDSPTDRPARRWPTFAHRPQV